MKINLVPLLQEYTVCDLYQGRVFQLFSILVAFLYRKNAENHLSIILRRCSLKYVKISKEMVTSIEISDWQILMSI